MARIQRKIERTPEDQAEIDCIRAMSRTPAGRAELSQSTGDKISSAGHKLLMGLLGALRDRREELGISQADLADRLGMDNTALCRLEAFKAPNPTAWTLLRWAEALGCTIGMDLRPAKEQVAVGAE